MPIKKQTENGLTIYLIVIVIICQSLQCLTFFLLNFLTKPGHLSTDLSLERFLFLLLQDCPFFAGIVLKIL